VEKIFVIGTITAPDVAATAAESVSVMRPFKRAAIDAVPVKSPTTSWTIPLPELPVVTPHNANNFSRAIRISELLIDCTLGEGGHSDFFLSSFDDLKIVGLDADENIQSIAKKRLADYGKRIRFYNVWFNTFFREYPLGDERPDSILFDLGISVYHYEKSGRGFSFSKDELLDMRLEPGLEISAADIVNNYPEEELADLIYEFGEERYSRRIARAVLKARSLLASSSARPESLCALGK